MAFGEAPTDPLTSAKRNAAAARARSARETGRAESHQVLADRAASTSLRDFHLSIADSHRSTAACHLTAARLQEDYASRLTGWAVTKSAPRPLFMTGVAAACRTSSAGLTLVGTTLDQIAVAASGEPARAAQELEFLLGEGPARDATSRVRPVSASGAALTARWPGYGPAVAELGIVEVAAVPLTLDEACVGALTVFDPPPGVIGSPDFAEVAEALTRSMILDPAGDPGLYGGTDLRALVHQAAGMVAEQLGCPVPDALEMIKLHAFTKGTSAHEVAARIAQGDLHLH